MNQDLILNHEGHEEHEEITSWPSCSSWWKRLLYPNFGFPWGDIIGVLCKGLSTMAAISQPTGRTAMTAASDSQGATGNEPKT
jgi:hypothetical protein